MKTVYFLLSKTDTKISKIIHFVNGGEFTHCSIALSPRTDKFMSFARRDVNNPLTACFIVEDLHEGIFGIYKDCHCSLYAVDLSDKAYQRMVRYIERNYIKSKTRSGYNYVGLFLLAFGIGIRRRTKRTCSQFVALTLDSSKEIYLPKKPFLMTPDDFKHIKNIRMIYEGSIGKCNFDRLALPSK